MQKYIFRLSFR